MKFSLEIWHLNALLIVASQGDVKTNTLISTRNIDLLPALLVVPLSYDSNEMKMIKTKLPIFSA